MAWFYLSCAILLEVLGMYYLKLSFGFSKFMPSLLTSVAFILSLIFAAYAMKQIDVSLVYAIWSGLGTLIVVTVGIVYFHEPSSLIKLACMALIMAGVVGLHVTSA